MVYTKINTRCYFNVQSKGDTSQLNLRKETTTKKWKTEKKTLKNKKTGMLKSTGKQSGESVQSVLEKKREATVGKICRK